MATYRITAPDGNSYTINGPEGASDATVVAALLAKYPEANTKRPETTFGGQVKEFGKGLLPGAVGLLESAATGASALLPDDLEKAARAKIKGFADTARAPLAAAPGYEQSVGRKFGESVGSVVPVLGMAALGPVGIAGAIATGVGAGAGEARTRAEQEGATAEQRRTSTMLGAGVGSTEALPVFRIIQRLGAPAASGALAYIRRAAAAGGEEAAQEAATNVAQNLIAKGIYKPDQEIIEGMGEAAGYGGATGAFVQGVLDLALGRRAKGATTKPGEPTEAEQRLQAAREQEEKARADALAKKEEEKNIRDVQVRRFQGEQGVLFKPGETPKPMLSEKDLQGNVLQRAEPGAEAPPAEPTRQEKTEAGQAELGLETARKQEDVVTERGALSLELESLKGERTAEARERRAEINDRIAELDLDLARREEERGPQVPAKGAPQGELFGAAPSAPRAAKETAPAPTEPTAPEGQLDMGIDALKDYAELVQEREMLRALPKEQVTPELQAYIRKLDQDIRDRVLYDLDLAQQKRAKDIEADKGKIREDELAAQSAFTDPNAKVTPRFPTPAPTPAPAPVAAAPTPPPAPAPAPAPQVEEQPVSEPTVRQAPTLQTVAPQLDLSLRSLLGIGPTANLFKPNGGIVGKDISDPVQAAEVKTTLEAYLERPTLSPNIVERVNTFLQRPEFQGVESGRPEQPKAPAPAPAAPSVSEQKPKSRRGKPSVAVSGEPAGAQPAEPGAGAAPTTGEPEGSVGRGLVLAEQPAGEGAAPSDTKPASLGTDRQQRIAFGKAINAAQSYPGDLRGRVNKRAQSAAKKGDFQGVLAALAESKNPIVAHIAKMAKSLGTKIVIDEEAGEQYVGRSTFTDQMSIDGAKMHLEALDKLRGFEQQVNALPDKAALPSDIASASVTAIDQGKELSLPLRLRNIVDNNNSMFGSLDLPEKRGFSTKEDFQALLKAFEKLTADIGESALRMTATASAIRAGVAGAYDASTDTIRVPEYFAQREEVLAHEIAHAQTVEAIANPTTAQRPAVQRLNKLYEHVKKVMQDRAKADPILNQEPYGVASIQEFAAEGIGNPKFQYELSRIKYQNSTAWDKFTEAVAKILGLKNDNAFTEFLTLYGEITAPQTETKAAPKPASKKAKTPKVVLPATPAGTIESLAKSVEGKEALPEEAPTTEKPAAESPFDYKGMPSVIGAKIQKEQKEGRKSVQPTVGKVQQTLGELQSQIDSGTGLIGGWLRRLLKSGKVRLEAIAPNGDATIGGLYNGDTVVLYAAGIQKGHVWAVALHEVGAHLGLEKLLGAKQYRELSQRIIDMARSKTASTERALAQRALRRIPKEDIARGEGIYRDEALAYFAEELVLAEMSGELPKVGPLRLMYNRIRAAVQATFNRLFGTNFGVTTFTPDQIGFLIKGAMGVEAFTDTRAGSLTETQKNLSVLKDKKTETSAFRKWFGNSVVVDSEGEPLVMYHGMPKEMEGGEFRPSSYGSLGEGIYFTSDPAAASNFATGKRYPGADEKLQGNVVPAYLKLEQPFDDNFFVGNKAWQEWAASILRKEAKATDPYWPQSVMWMGGPAAERQKILTALHDKLMKGEATLNDLLFVGANTNEAPWGKEILEAVKEHGAFDGVILKNSPKGFDEYLVYKSNQVKSATGNAGTYNPNNPDIRFSRTMPQEDIDYINTLSAASPLPPEQEANIIKQGYEGVRKAQKVAGLVPWIRQHFADKYASVLSKTSQYFSQGVRDSFGNLNNEVLLRQADDHAKLTQAFLHMGGIEIDKDGLVKIVKEKESVVSVFKAVVDFGKTNGMDPKQSMAFFSTLLEGNRLYGLEKQGFKVSMTREQMAEAKRILDNSPDAKAILDDLNIIRERAIKLMVATGRISQQQADAWNSAKDYVPFNRIFDEDEKAGTPYVIRGKGIAVLRNIPALVGSYGRPVENVLDAFAERMGYMISESLRNQASVKTLEIMRLAGYADTAPSKEASKNPGLVVPRLYKDGKPVFYEVQNPYDLAAFQQAPEVTNGIINAMAAVSRVLRLSITAMPPFAAKQVLDDAQRAMFYSGVERPVVVAIKTLYNFPRIFFGELTGRKSPAVREMEAYGIVGDYDSNLVRPTQDMRYELGIDARSTGANIIHFLEKITKASDLAARSAVFEETMRETKGDAQLAQTRARELINFSRRGSSSTMRTLTKVVPFFNAYAQGMDVLYRAASGIDSSSAAERSAARKLFYSRMGIMFAIGTVYAMSMGGDDDYESTTEEVRDNNWIFPGGYKLPVPKELGFLFKSIPERLVGYLNRYGTDEEQGVQEALGSLFKGAFAAYTSPTAVPSTIKPFLEHMTNYSFFMQRELVPSSMKERPAGIQYTSDTSELAKLLGGAADVSPIVVDNYLRGFFGMAASTTLMMTDAVLNPTRPDRPIYQLPFANIVRYDIIGGREKSEFYDLREKVMKARNGYNALQKTDPVAADAFAEKNYALIDAAPEVNRLLTELSSLRKERVLYEQGTAEVVGELSGTERRQLIDEIRKEEKSVLSDIRKLKKFIRDEQQ